MKENIVFMKSIVLLLLVVFLYGFTTKRNDQRKVLAPIVEFSNGDNLFLSHEMVNKLLIQKVGRVENEPKSLINLHEFENRVNENSLVEHTKVYMTIDGSIKALITQRTPVARVNTGSEVYYIDKQGLKMPLSTNYSARVLLVSGAVTEQDIPAVFSLVKKINGNEFLTNLIVGIHKYSTSEYVLQTRLFDQHIQLGKIVDLNTKFKKLEAFYNKAIQDKDIENYKTINLKYNNQVVCTKD
ncbi:cell division protein FtsQ/DivIB [Flavicella sediminum]|uniref:cell division protein FtsQ/DivIB n=1 Tax=Flavicella sediminum TaxID=2585141 RepID=UPI00112339C5|nr:cell division protein FtsQ [Flavicella sediminum]